MPAGAPLLRIYVAQRQREEKKATRTRAKYDQHPQYRPPQCRPSSNPPILTMTFIFIPSFFYLVEVHRGLPLDRA